jgi:hypothetical protein
VILTFSSRRVYRQSWKRALCFLLQAFVAGRDQDAAVVSGSGTGEGTGFAELCTGSDSCALILSRGSRAMPSSVANGSHESDRLWAFESRIDGTGEQRKVVLGVDGGGTCTTCVCVAAPLPVCADDLQWLSRVETGCSNYNSVGGRYSLSLFFRPLCALSS